LAVILCIMMAGIFIFDKRVSRAETAASGCGNGSLDSNEECDGGSLNGGGCSVLCEAHEAGSAVYPCSDSLDNDNDGLTDAEDPGCHTDWNAANDISYNPAWAGEYEIDRISISTDGVEGNSDSVVSSGYYISDDGRYAVFMSAANNLVEGDNNNRVDIFLRDRLLGTTKRISVAPDGTDANGASMYPSISANGNYVKFYSNATNLAVGNDYNPRYGYIYDRLADVIIPVSRAAGMIPFSEIEALFSPSYMGGKYFVFYSSVNGLVEGDNDGRVDIFILDSETGEVRQVSKAYDGTESNGSSILPSISRDGRYVVFTSSSSNLVAGDTNGKADVFVYDVQSERIVRVNLGVDGGEAAQHSNIASLSPNGKYVAFYSNSWNLVPADYNGEMDVFVVKNPLFREDASTPPMPTDLKQANGFDGAEIGAGKIINEGADASMHSIFFSAKVGDAERGRAALEVRVAEIDEASGTLSWFEPVRSGYVQSGETASVAYVPGGGGLYAWKARTVDETGAASDWVEFGNNAAAEADFISSNFSFVFLADVHLGSNTAFWARQAGKDWYESQSYSRFADVLYEIENLVPAPDFILIGGDNVEYGDTRWLGDFRSITEGFAKRTGIGVYVVPGNHDRYDSAPSAMQLGEMDFSGGNDELGSYFSVMGQPESVTSLFSGDAAIMDAVRSNKGGYNRYNYYFDHKGMRFIGLDSGEDTGVSDPDPEGSGLDEHVMIKLRESANDASDAPKIIFMHHPVYNDAQDKWGERNSDGEIAEENTITDNRMDFIDYCATKGVQLILSGHTHDSLLSDSSDRNIELSDWLADKAYPLYLQTQSAGKEDDHGYRIVDVQNGKAIPRESKTGVTAYEKVYADLDPETALDFAAYDSDGRKMTVEDAGKATLFIAEDSDKQIIYDDAGASRFEIKNKDNLSAYYDLQLQKREEGFEIETGYAPVAGYRINNANVCASSDLFCPGFIYLVKQSGAAILGFEDMRINGNSSNTVSVAWDNVGQNDIFGGMEGVSLTFDENNNTTYSKFPVIFAADIGSPGELRVIDKKGNITGLVDGEIVEDIPYSIYVPESETVYVFGNSSADVSDLKIQIVGAYEATYDLALSLSENDTEKAKFTADDILTNKQAIHQFGVDWGVLSEGGKGVTMEFDEDGIEGFERAVISDGSLSFPKAVLGRAKYEANEGAGVTFDASGSADSDGSIVLYEWDFDGDGAYDASSAEPTITHIYGDDYSGKVFLRVTDDEGLTDRSSIVGADVSILNTAPSVSILKLDIADTFDDFILEGDFADVGWLDTHTASIDWGDGSTDDNVSLSEENIYPNAAGKVSALHRYAKLENYAVKLTVKDDDGGTATSEIMLESPRQMKQAVLSQLKIIQTGDKDALRELNQSIASMEESLADEYWQDDFHLDPILMNKFFSLDQKITKSLEKIISGEKKYADFGSGQDIQGILDELDRSNIFLAKIMVYEAGSLEAKDLKSAKEWAGKVLESKTAVRR